MTTPPIDINRLFSESYGSILATLIRHLGGDFDRAEEALQEALLAATRTWPVEGMPSHPDRWLLKVARRKAIDQMRRDQTRRQHHQSMIVESESTVDSPTSADSDDESNRDQSLFLDDRLRLVFTCCHPALTPEARIALTLHTLGGLTTEEIARAFLIKPTTLGQRLSRAKAKIRAARIPYHIPAPEELDDRLPSVLVVIYLIFNEGYAAATGDTLIRRDLCTKALQLGVLLTQLMPNEPEVWGLLALMCFTDSRRAARQNERGELILLEDQDRSLWNMATLNQGFNALQQARDLADTGFYLLQALIAAEHARSIRKEDTNWPHIVYLYGRLYDLHPTPIIALNRAVAVAMAEGPAVGLALVETLSDADLNHYVYYHTARADLLRRLGRREDARLSYEHARGLTGNLVEQKFIDRRLRECS